ncbi:hypothetical protein T265_11554 [Opisthorchis viverrini]|uniref:Uncharacterized protein n=1 Tax=Opisthorchis viverrini TaxID=6198 RepID=A0A074YYM8_OPIVI|nr:hypothetical protein T265_11554 [Opisthorchis viverrini]KER19758.1 hypothetical protein T265_11554 [Opisthorchis viverrini]
MVDDVEDCDGKVMSLEMPQPVSTSDTSRNSIVRPTSEIPINRREANTSADEVGGAQDPSLLLFSNYRRSVTECTEHSNRMKSNLQCPNIQCVCNRNNGIPEAFGSGAGSKNPDATGRRLATGSVPRANRSLALGSTNKRPVF